MNENKLRTELTSLAREIARIKKQVLAFEASHCRDLSRVCPENLAGAKNLLHYLALRQIDLKNLQLRLSFLGLSSLGRCESFVWESLCEVHQRLNESLWTLGGKRVAPRPSSRGQNWLEAESQLHHHTRSLLGQRPQNRHVYVMITAPNAEEVTDVWAREMLLAGTNLVRINCAHENELAWKVVIGTVRNVAANLGVQVNILMDLGGPKLRVKEPRKIRLRTGARIRILKRPGRSKDWIVCGVPEALDFVREGHRVAFDDGKAMGRVLKSGQSGLLVEITHVNKEGQKLKEGNGINFPDSNLKIPEVTEEDLDHLEFIAHHADLVGLSFAQTPAAIRKVRRELERYTEKVPGLILKIETRIGFNHLPKLLLEAMREFPVGVMIARGDLAVETGFERLVEIQEEILWLCEAARVPVIWATQVLENLAKTGQPSRAEISDAGLSVRAECVMLNKGPFIADAVRTLDDILRRMERHVYKKRNLYRPLHVAHL